ncbi:MULTISPECIES: hypothetical protein [unclassified Nostoc]|uniref:hypothetical protein n=1 Tax=unclassified Nostoc TaxID=2593658 RepID=UPI000CA2B03E|nr:MULTISPECIES: hypothetical protein [unclassified Nostoc]AUT04563.1 hypothetical protein CLI64_29405 [Nostoc sp. CENA543]MBC1240892.1 hypothetical protein [Nostoc sp. 2RC]
MAKVERESINFKLPKPLVEALRATAKERNTTATDLVIQGLRYVLGEVNGMETDVETRLHQLEAELNRLTSGIESSVENQLGQHSHRLSSLEQKLEAMATKLAQLEGALNAGQRYKSPARRQGYAYNSQVPQSLELQPFLAENLAKRLGVDTATLAREQKNKSQFEFESWSRNRDPSSTAWRYQDDGLYHPIK